MSDFTQTYYRADLRWIEGDVTHDVDGASVHPGVVLMWPICGQGDVPGGKAFKATSETPTTCPACLRALSKEITP